MTRRAAIVLLAVSAGGLLVAIVLGMLWTAPRDLDAQLREVSLTLRCPSCIAESVADSASPVSEAMRSVVADQLREGRSPDEIRSWFAARYGDEVLLDPPPTGHGWMLWAVPALLVGAAVLLAIRRRSPRAVAIGVASAAVLVLVLVWAGSSAWPRAGDAELAAGAPEEATLLALEGAVAAAPGDAGLRLALAGRLEAESRHLDAAEHLAVVTRLRPFDPEPSYRHAMALLRGGDEERAVAALDAALALDPEHRAALLARAALAWQRQEEGAELLLRAVLEDLPGLDAEALLDGLGTEPR